MHVSPESVRSAPTLNGLETRARVPSVAIENGHGSPVPLPSPRRVSEWASIFESIETSELSALPTLRPTIAIGLENISNANDESLELPQMETTPVPPRNYTVSSGGADTHFECDGNGTTVNRGNSSHDACASQRRAPLNIANRALPKGAADRKAKRKKAKEHAVFRSLTTKTCSTGSEADSRTAQHHSSDVIPELESEKKIRNRASVQRCRERKSHYYDRLEKTRLALRRENKILQTVLDDMSSIIEAYGIALSESK